MRLNEIDYSGPPPIDGYGPGFFRIDNKVHEGNLLLLGGTTQPWGGYDDLDALIAAADTFDVLFLGTGAEIAQPPEHVMTRLTDAGIPPDLMATAPACRTYNILLAEGRRIAAALIAV